MSSISLKAIALIPARYGSTRLKAKALMKINGIPMIEHVYKNMSKGSFEVAVVTDHDEIESCVKNVGGKVLRVNDEVATGSERIGLAYKRYLKDSNYDFIVNVQGDEPLLKSYAIDQLLQFHAKSKFDIATLTYPRKGEADFQNPNTVKIAFNQTTGQCYYFSRSAIPFYRQNKETQTWKWYQHVGVYCYRPKILEQFLHLPSSELETAETLEQLRALEAGLLIGATCIDQLLQSVDTLEDVTKVEDLLNARNK